jgi:hypothetical protein
MGGVSCGLVFTCLFIGAVETNLTQAGGTSSRTCVWLRDDAKKAPMRWTGIGA